MVKQKKLPYNDMLNILMDVKRNNKYADKLTPEDILKLENACFNINTLSITARRKVASLLEKGDEVAVSAVERIYKKPCSEILALLEAYIVKHDENERAKKAFNKAVEEKIAFLTQKAKEEGHITEGDGYTAYDDAFLVPRVARAFFLEGNDYVGIVGEARNLVIKEWVDAGKKLPDGVKVE